MTGNDLREIKNRHLNADVITTITTVVLKSNEKWTYKDYNVR